MANILWYAKRLRSMGGAEVAWRVNRAIDARYHALTQGVQRRENAWQATLDWSRALDQFRRCTDRPVLLDRQHAARVSQAQPEVRGDVIDAAERSVQRRFSFFGYAEVMLSEPIDWNADPISGARWPSVRASRIDYRTYAGDVKWIWELNRLQHLPWLAQAWLLTSDDRFSRAAFTQLDSWLEQNPPGIGIAWRNPFEVGIRAISIALALQGFRDSDELTVERYRSIVSVLADGAQRCWSDRSRFSSANNHLVGELAGLAVVAMLFPELPGARQWEQQAMSALSVEAGLQILPDGVGAEQAVGYQIFTAELLMIVVALLCQRDGRAPAALLSALQRSADYLAVLVDAADPDPRYGDDDEGFALRLGAEPVRTVRDHLGAVAALTGSDAARQYGNRTWTAEWLDAIRPRTSSPPECNSSLETVGQHHYAPDGGLVVLRRDDRRVLMDVGPLGYLSIAAHGHADALSVTVSLDGQDIIGDPGAASYYGHPDWRRAHRSTRVHATVEVDGVDQAVAGGAFLWSRHTHTRIRTVDLDRGVVDAEHFGYDRLPNPVTHRRWLVAPSDSDDIVVVDLISGRGRHLVRTSWPVHPALTVVPDTTGHLIHGDQGPLARIESAGTVKLTAEQVRADESNHLGWWSDRLESRRPAFLVGHSHAGELPVVIATVIRRAADGPADIQARHRGAAIDVEWRTSGGERRLSINTTLPGAVTLTAPTPRSALCVIAQASRRTVAPGIESGTTPLSVSPSASSPQ